MRHASVVLRASVAVIVAMSVGACAASTASPSTAPTAPAASANVAAAGSADAVQSPIASTRAAPSPTPSFPAGAKIDGRIQVGDPVAPRWFAADDTSLWVHQPTSLVRVDLATSAVTGQIPLPYMEYGYDTTGASSIWQTDYEGDHVLRIDPVTGKVVKSIQVGSAPTGVAVTAGSVWVADEHSEAVTRVDPATNRVVATITIGQPGPAGPQIMTAGPGGVWVDVDNMDEVVRIDAATNKVGLRVPLSGPVASDGKEVWIAVYAGQNAGQNGLSQVVRIDPVSGKVITTVDLHSQGSCGLAVGLGSVWVADGGLTRIDEATGRIVGHLDTGGDCGNVVVAGGAVWVTADGQPYVLRIAPP
jgi:YVTN family beta-propeller protein